MPDLGLLALPCRGNRVITARNDPGHHSNSGPPGHSHFKFPALPRELPRILTRDKWAVSLHLVLGARCGAKSLHLWGGLAGQEFIARAVEVDSTSSGHIACLMIPLPCRISSKTLPFRSNTYCSIKLILAYHGYQYDNNRLCTRKARGSICRTRTRLSDRLVARFAKRAHYGRH